MSWLIRNRFAPLIRRPATRQFNLATRSAVDETKIKKFLLSLLKKALADKVEEEQFSWYKPEFFYPAKLGETVNGVYQLVAKLGFGTTSTVWLARDTSKWKWQYNRYVTLKIGVNNHSPERAIYEVNLSQHIANANPSHPGRQFVRTTLDAFEIKGPDGVHPVLVYEAMREPVWMLQRRLGGKFAPDLLKTTLGFILTGLDYLHNECHIVHTDLKTDNILVPFESTNLIDKFIQRQIETPFPHKELPDGRIIYLSRQDFGDIMLKKRMGPPRISDFGAAVQVTDDIKKDLTHRIQPPGYVAPEVCLGAPWGYSADIWNLGLLIWELLEDQSLFEGRDPEYDTRTERMQLADIVSLLGPPPKSLLSRGSKSHLFFDPFGRFKFKKFLSPPRSLESTITVLKDHDKDAFIDFAKCMLTWVPEERKTAKQLLDHPWLNS